MCLYACMHAFTYVYLNETLPIVKYLTRITEIYYLPVLETFLNTSSCRLEEKNDDISHQHISIDWNG